ncbi:MAG: glutamine--fructose-6-phosphate transaminase (isomerizing) [Bacilli bacterium]|nr:glutamine--fructose-6-phosphate transaminase (isomerizing) [Bacilli bacterium]
MCGIVGYVGKKNAIPYLIQGLRKLEYRGYDSAGIAYLDNNKIEIKKTVGRISDLEKIVNINIPTNIGIGHTRWATHGKVNNTNSHPHQVGDITIVHNGILENYQELKNELLKLGYKFKTETDTEVLCAYIDYEYKNSSTKDMVEIFNNCFKVFKGSYAVTIMVASISDKIFVMKKDNPLVIGIGESENYIASDVSAFISNTCKFIYLEDMQIGIVSSSDVSIYQENKLINNDIKTINIDDVGNGKEEYEHYMLKEIYEQSNLIEKLNSIYLNSNLDDFDISKYTSIHIIGCGTAYHAGLIGKYLMEKYNDFEINVYIASEYRYQKIFVNDKTLVIAVSQSGETADTLACLKRVKKCGCDTLGIVNVKNSTIARIVDRVIYTMAGQEIAVASTKAYTSQIYIFSLLALKIGISKGVINKEDITSYYNELPQLINNVLNINYDRVVKKIFNNEYLFYLGRNIDYVSVMEGSLKIKEISYIHSEAYQGGELKHGTISLIEKDSCVISLVSNEETSAKIISNIKEVKARGAYVILIIKDSLNINIDINCYDQMIIIPSVHELIQPILNIIPLQLIAYYVAKKRGCDIDKPRNLAKSVTVE